MRRTGGERAFRSGRALVMAPGSMLLFPQGACSQLLCGCSCVCGCARQDLGRTGASSPQVCGLVSAGQFCWVVSPLSLFPSFIHLTSSPHWFMTLWSLPGHSQWVGTFGMISRDCSMGAGLVSLCHPPACRADGHHRAPQRAAPECPQSCGCT